MVERVTDGFGPIQSAAVELGDCLDQHKGEVVAARCFAEVTKLRNLLAEQSDHLGAWAPYT